MLDLRLDQRDYQNYMDATEPTALTILDPIRKRTRAINTVGMPVQQPIYSVSLSLDPNQGTVYTRPTSEDAPLRPVDLSPTPIELTNKISTGVYEDTLPTYTRRSDFQTDGPLVDATLLNNPAVDGFETYANGSPLGTGYANDQAGYMSGSDPANVPAPVDNSPMLSASTTTDECWIPGITSGCLIRKDVRNETILFVIGAILLTVGIYAMTR